MIIFVTCGARFVGANFVIDGLQQCEEHVVNLDELRKKADGSACKSQITFVTDRVGHNRHYAIDVARIEQESSWKLAETFETGIRKTVQWYLDHRAWVAKVTGGEYRNWVESQCA